MKLYAFYTPSHNELLEDWFLSSIQDDFDVVIESKEQVSSSGSFMEEGWLETMKEKVRLILRASEENEGTLFIHSDVDIQFFKAVIPIITTLIEDYDMLIQKSLAHGYVCPGFFVARGGTRFTQLWTDILHDLNLQTEKHDQNLLNEKLLGAHPLQHFFSKLLTGTIYIPKNEYAVRWKYLPDTFYSPGIDRNRPGLWEPGESLEIPENIVLHHANWTRGVENKIAQLKYVQEHVQENSTRS